MIDAKLIFNQDNLPDQINYPKVCAILFQELEEQDSELLSKLILKESIVSEAFSELTLLSDRRKAEESVKEKFKNFCEGLTNDEKDVVRKMQRMGQI